MITNLNTEGGWSPQQVLIEADKIVDDMDVVVISYFKKGTGGEACLMHSVGDNRDLLFLAKALEYYIIGQ